MKIFYYKNHNRHNPPTEFTNSGTTKCFEKPARLAKIMEQISFYKKDIILYKGQPLRKEYLQIIYKLHHKEMIDFYLSIMKSNKAGYRAFNKYIFSEIFFRGNLYSPDFHKNNNLLGPMGKLGQFCTDTATSISKTAMQVAFQNAFMVIEAVKYYMRDNTQGSIRSGRSRQPSDQSVYVLTRPPGHHAGKNFFGGYCYLNNSAVAAQTLLESLKKRGKRERVAILDIDYHHGNGTQDIFYDREDVIVISIHANPEHEYPYLQGFSSEKGIGKGKNCNLNIPLPLNCNNLKYLQALEKAHQFLLYKQVKWIIVSLSFDFLKGDPLGGFKNVDIEVFKGFKNIFQNYPKPILIQEGGYNLKKIGKYAKEFLKLLE